MSMRKILVTLLVPHLKLLCPGSKKENKYFLKKTQNIVHALLKRKEFGRLIE